MLHHKERNLESVKDLIDPFHEQQHPTLHHSSRRRLSAYTTNGSERRRGEADALQIPIHRLTASTRNQSPCIVLSFPWAIVSPS